MVIIRCKMLRIQEIYKYYHIRQTMTICVHHTLRFILVKATTDHSLHINLHILQHVMQSPWSQLIRVDTSASAIGSYFEVLVQVLPTWWLMDRNISSFTSFELDTHVHPDRNKWGTLDITEPENAQEA